MKVSELIKILSKYPSDVEVRVLEKQRKYGGELSNIVNLNEVFDQDTGKLGITIETDYEGHIVNGN